MELLKTLGREPAKEGKRSSRVVLAVDATGVGRPVVDMLRKGIREARADAALFAGLSGTPCWITITGVTR